MTTFDNNLRGVLFKNAKDGNDKRADYRGSCEIGGVSYWISAWINTSKAEEKYMSLRFEPKEARAPRSPPAIKSAPKKDYTEDFNDDIPF